MVSTFIRWMGWAESPAQDSMLKPAHITGAAVCMCVEVDLEHISERLLVVVEETMQPERASLWLRQSDRPQKAAISAKMASTAKELEP